MPLPTAFLKLEQLPDRGALAGDDQLYVKTSGLLNRKTTLDDIAAYATGGLAGEVAALEVAVSGLSADVTSLSGDVSALTATVSGLSTTVSGLSTTVASHTTTLASHSAELATHQAAIDGAADEIADIETVQLPAKQGHSVRLDDIVAASTGIVVNDAAASAVVRAIAAVDGKITVSNGNGVSGNPTIGFGSVALADLTDGAATEAELADHEARLDALELELANTVYYQTEAGQTFETEDGNPWELLV